MLLTGLAAPEAGMRLCGADPCWKSSLLMGFVTILVTLMCSRWGLVAPDVNKQHTFKK
jgi:hypothetical protein